LLQGNPCKPLIALNLEYSSLRQQFTIWSFQQSCPMKFHLHSPKIFGILFLTNCHLRESFAKRLTQ
jgi:hypothetical protein